METTKTEEKKVLEQIISQIQVYVLYSATDKNKCGVNMFSVA